MLKFAMFVRMSPQKVVKPVTDNARKRLAIASGMVERKAKQLVSKGGGKGTPGADNSYYYGRPLNRWVRKASNGAPPNLQTGTLRNSIKFEFIAPLIAIVGPSVSYGRYQEFGTRGMPEHPFMRPALQSVSLTDYFRRLIK